MKLIREYWPTMLVLGVILYATLSSDPIGADRLPLIPHIDKLIHAVMMGGLVSAIAFDYQRAHRSERVLTTKLMTWIVAGVAAFCVVDELAQAYLTANRAGDILDFAADIVGCIAAALLCRPAIYKVLRK